MSVPPSGILSKLSLQQSPLMGDIFTPEAIREGQRLFRDAEVKLVTSTVQDSFAGIFGRVKDTHQGSHEVSLVIQGRDLANLQVDGHDTTSGEYNSGAVVALFLAAKAKHGGSSRVHYPRLSLLKVNAMSEDADPLLFFRSPLRGLPVLRIDMVDGNGAVIDSASPGGEHFERLDQFGLCKLDQVFDRQEIDPAFKECRTFDTPYSMKREERWAEFLCNDWPQLERAGWRMECDDSFGIQVINPAADDWFGMLVSNHDEEQSIDWFDFRYGVNHDGREISLLPVIVGFLQSSDFDRAQLEESADETLVPVYVEQESCYVPIPAGRLRGVLSILTELFDPDILLDDGALRLHPLRAAQMVAADRGKRLFSKSPHELVALRDSFLDAKASGEGKGAPPVEFQGTLRPYQQEGYEWLQLLRKKDLGGILADDMGLGKTVQTLCHLVEEKRTGRADLPCLIVAPTSVLGNWRDESATFAPGLSTMILQGAKRKRYHSLMQACDLVITSYPVILRDADIFLKQRFHYIVLDEAHMIKNARSKTTQVICKLNARFRLCLSGTPLENHLGELWSLFHFLAPGFLGTEKTFSRIYRQPIEKERDEERRNQLVQRVAPLMLRRTKRTVVHDLPPKTEMVRYVELNPSQMELYEAVRASMDKRIREEVARQGIEASRLLILDALLKLRQICCHPKLLKLPSAQLVKDSAKLDFVTDMLRELIEEGRRILIFSGFTKMLDLLEKTCGKLNVTTAKLTGATRDRDAEIKKFREGGAEVFLISLKAGGTGLNLTTADTVIHYDPWWNPAAEAQATDRAYRIGQKNPVFVYKLITRGTIEEKILDLQEKKRALYEGILQNAPTNSLQLDMEDIDTLLAPAECS
ncbi:MAG: superfamily II DNA or RNA helicase [Verrucomicrobiales bacterium]|jgi:superfamily II DNA or RNA helicase